MQRCLKPWLSGSSVSDSAGEVAQLSEAAVAMPHWPHLIHLHRELDSAWSLYRGKYYDEAVRKASQRFSNRVKDLSNRPDLDGSALMEHAFSAQSPLLEFSDRGTFELPPVSWRVWLGRVG